MSPTLAKKRLNVPADNAAMRDYLQLLGLGRAADGQLIAARVLKHFQDMAADGYDLGLADGTAEVEARKKAGDFPAYFRLTGFSEMTRMIFKPNGKQEVEYEGIVKARVGGVDFQEIDESAAGSVHAIRSAFRKILRRNYEASPIRLIGYHVDSFRLNREENKETPHSDAIKSLDEEDKIDTASPTRVTIVFSTLARGKLQTYAVQDVQTGVMGASVMAVAKGLELGLYKQGIKPKF